MDKAEKSESLPTSRVVVCHFVCKSRQQCRALEQAEIFAILHTCTIFLKAGLLTVKASSAFLSTKKNGVAGFFLEKHCVWNRFLTRLVVFSYRWLIADYQIKKPHSAVLPIMKVEMTQLYLCEEPYWSKYDQSDLYEHPIEINVISDGKLQHLVPRTSIPPLLVYTV